MTITGVITAILIGIVVGVLGRLLVPGKQPIGMLVTILIGIVGAFLGTAIARALGIPTVTNGIDWLELLVQVIVAAIGVALVSSIMGRRRTGVVGGRRRSSLFRLDIHLANPAAPLAAGFVHVRTDIWREALQGLVFPASEPSSSSPARPPADWLRSSSIPLRSD